MSDFRLPCGESERKESGISPHFLRQMCVQPHGDSIATGSQTAFTAENAIALHCSYTAAVPITDMSENIHMFLNMMEDQMFVCPFCAGLNSPSRLRAQGCTEEALAFVGKGAFHMLEPIYPLSTWVHDV